MYIKEDAEYLFKINCQGFETSFPTILYGCVNGGVISVIYKIGILQTYYFFWSSCKTDAFPLLEPLCLLL